MAIDSLRPKKTYIRVPPPEVLKRHAKITRALAGGVLSPLYWLMAYPYQTPGLKLRIDFGRLGLRLLFSRNPRFSYREIYRLFFWPIDSVRYFEFDCLWRALSDVPIAHYLDVSSPRLFPVLLLMRRPGLTAELVNPDKRDLDETAKFIESCGLDSRCRLRHCLIEETPFAPESFDVVTSISVVEHIPRDREAFLKMWELVKRGGRLLLSVPCAAAAEEEYVDVDFFGLQAGAESGFFFHQYLYDQDLLEERFYSVAGPPVRRAIFGEKKPGTLQRGLLEKWSGGRYPLWKEPYIMGREFQYYESPAELPGVGVIAMEFLKK